MNTESVLPILGELLAKSALITLAAVLLARGWRGATAAQRHLVWWVALVTVMMLPLTRLIAPRWRIPLHPTKTALTVKMEPSVMPTVPIEEAVPMELPVASTPVHRSLDWRRILLGAWLGGAAILLGYRLFGSWRLHRLRRRSKPFDDPRIRLLLGRTLSELHLRRRPEIRLSEECRVPITWGSLRPVMLLPKAALQWSDAWVLAALRHECAHIRRYDYLTRWFAQVACAVYWPNPLVWLLARSLRVAQELAADDLVLRAGTPAEEYASQLVEAAREITTHGFFVRQAVAMACPSTLEDRVRAIVDGRRDRRPLSRVAAACGSLAIAGALCLSTAAQLRSDEQKQLPVTGEVAAKSSAPLGPEIQIEAKFIEMNPSVAMGADGQIGGPGAHTDQPAIFTDPQFQLIIRALNQKKGVDVLSSPRVTTRLNLRAVLEIVREFRTPTEWKKEGETWKPTKFETKNLGLTLEVEPRPAKDGAVEMHTISSVVNFLGFLDLDTGKTIPAPRTAPGDPVEMPPVVPGHRSKAVYSERRKESTVTLQSDETFLVADLPETADTKAFEKEGSRNRIMVFISPRLIASLPAAAAKGANGADRATVRTSGVSTFDKAGAGTLNSSEGTPGPNGPGQSVAIGGALNIVPESDEQFVRRIYLGITAQQPTPAQIRAFLDDSRPSAEKRQSIVEKLAPAAGSDAEFLRRIYLDIAGRQPTIDELRAFLDNPQPSVEKRQATLARLTASHGDAEFLRHVYLDITGRPPTPEEVRAFLGGSQPSAEKRKALIEKLTGGGATKNAAAGAAQPPGTKAVLITKEWKVPPHLIPMKPDGSGPENARDWLISRGIAFEGAASASVPKPLHLIVRNTQAQLDLIDQLIVAWNETHPIPAADAAEARPATPRNPVAAKAEKIVIPKIAFHEATLDEVLDFLRKKAVELDPDKTGVKINVQPGLESNDMRMTLSLVNIPLIEALHYVADLAGAGLRVTPDALVIQPATGGDRGANVPLQSLPGLDPVTSLPPGVGAAPEPAKTEAPHESPTLNKAAKIIIPKVEFRDATLDEAVDFLRVKARELDPDKAGINIVVKPGTSADLHITISLTNIPLIEALHYVAELAGLQMKSERDAVVFSPKASASAAPPKGKSASNEEKPVEITADKTGIEQGVAIADGHAHLVFGKYDASADSIRYHPETHIADFSGHAEVKDGTHRIQGGEISITLSTGSIQILGPHRTTILSH